MGVTNLSEVKNKIKRQQKFRSIKVDKAKAKLAERKQRAQAEKLDPKLKEVQPAPYRVLIYPGTTKNKYPCYTRK
jgi:hypothetical protein